MLKSVFSIVGILVLSANVQAKEWYQEEGTLHTATMKQWCKAEHKNKLVTAGDIISTAYSERMFKPEIIDGIKKAGMQGIKLLAQEVVDGLDEAACNGKKVIPEMSNQKVNQMTAMLMLLMEWVK